MFSEIKYVPFITWMYTAVINEVIFLGSLYLYHGLSVRQGDDVTRHVIKGNGDVIVARTKAFSCENDSGSTIH